MQNKVSQSQAVGNLLTSGSIVKIGVIEFAVLEILILLFIVLRDAMPNGFSITVNGRIIAMAGNAVADFVALSLLACMLVAVMTACLWVGQCLLRHVIPLSFRLWILS